MRFRLLRSRAFWLGVPGLVFLLWAWVHSFSHMALAGFSSPGAVIGGSVQGVLIVGTGTGVGVNWRDPWVHYQPRLGSVDVVAFVRQTPGGEFLTVPYAAVVVVYVLAWAGLVVWRARKYRAVGSDAPADRNGP